jgi:Rifampin ADP-ribosyl transferase
VEEWQREPLKIGDSDQAFIPRSKFLSRHQGQLETRRTHQAGVQLQLREKGDGCVCLYVSTLNAAIWGAELAFGEEPGRIYVVEATGSIEDDPNLTDKKYPGNPTLSYRTREALRVIGEVIDWQGHSADELNNMKANVDRSRQRGVEVIED